MPVPVPRQSKLPAHRVHKCGNDTAKSFQQLTHTLPISPTGPPPSFGTREEWINSLPSWRKLKPRRIWEDDNIRVGEGRGEHNFPEGLTGAANASVIKGTHAQASMPPLFTLLQSSSLVPVAPQADMLGGCDEDADDEMSSDCSAFDQRRYDNESQWSAGSPAANVDEEMDGADATQYGVEEDRPGWHRDDGVIFDEQPYERGAFSPVYEDDSPQMVDGPDVASSPIGPATPFGEFVDRAVATAEAYTSLEPTHSGTHPAQYESQHQFSDDVSGQCQAYQEELKVAAPILEPATIPSSTVNYKKLASPLADWVASYVWKVCTTGMSLPSEFVTDKYVFHAQYPRVCLLTSHRSSGTYSSYSHVPPSHLAGSVHSLLLSTLLQPSAVLLALRYITRLPVFLGGGGLGTGHAKESCFRAELFGDPKDGGALEMNAPFRLILVGCMLANKWLDDHTFSNKTW
jgi:hypothetical protein